MKDDDEHDEKDDSVGILERTGDVIYSAVHGTVAVARPVVSFAFEVI